MSRILWFLIGGLTAAAGIGVAAIVRDDMDMGGTGEIDEAPDMDEATTDEAKQPETFTEEGAAAESTDLNPESSASSTDSQLAAALGQGGTTGLGTTDTTATDTTGRREKQ